MKSIEIKNQPKGERIDAWSVQQGIRTFLYKKESEALKKAEFLKNSNSEYHLYPKIKVVALKKVFWNLNPPGLFNNNFVLDAIKGEGSYYCDYLYGSDKERRGEKQMKKDRYSLSLEGFEFIQLLESLRRRKEYLIKYKEHLKKMIERKNQIEICLNAEPIELEDNTGKNKFIRYVANLKGSSMQDAYHGCGKGTAYLENNANGNVCMVAFHYGYEKPENALNLKSEKVDFSSNQICFSS